jgi:hypothetical protein
VYVVGRRRKLVGGRFGLQSKSCDVLEHFTFREIEEELQHLEIGPCLLPQM